MAIGSDITVALRRGWQRLFSLGVRPKASVLTGDGDPVYETALDSITSGLNHEKLGRLMEDSHLGALDIGLQLCEDMERLDSNLMCVCNTRRRALTALDWEVQSAADTSKGGINKADADAAAEYVRDVLGGLDCFEAYLREQAMAIGRNLAVTEVVWEGMRPADLIPVSAPRLIMDHMVPGLVRVRTKDNAVGYPAITPDFIVHMPHGSTKQPFKAAPVFSPAREWLMKQMAKADWSRYVNIFGVPFRWGKYDESATDEQKTKLLRLLSEMGRLSFGAFSKNIDLELKESSQRGTSPHQGLIDWVSKEQAKLMLGGNLTSDTTGGTGTYAAGQVQDEVREDLRDDDIAAEGETIREQLIAPMVYFRFWRAMPLPKFRRVKPEADDRLQIAQLVEVVQRNGAQVGRDWFHDAVFIPKPADDEDVLEAKPAALPGFMSDATQPPGRAWPGRDAAPPQDKAKAARADAEEDGDETG